MSDAARHCTSCGAPAPRDEARFCEQCGAALPAAAPPAPVADPVGDLGERFARLRASPRLEELLARAPEIPELGGPTLPSVLMLVVLGLLGILASLLFLQLCPPLGFAPLALVVVGIVVVARRLVWNARAPLSAHPAVVVELRAKLQAGAEHSPSHTRHHAALAFEDGTRSEPECFASALAGLRVGAAGVAYLKGERLAAFREIRT